MTTLLPTGTGDIEPRSRSCALSSRHALGANKKSTRLNSSHTIISYDWSSDVCSSVAVAGQHLDLVHPLLPAAGDEVARIGVRRDGAQRLALARPADQDPRPRIAHGERAADRLGELVVRA